MSDVRWAVVNDDELWCAEFGDAEGFVFAWGAWSLFVGDDCVASDQAPDLTAAKAACIAAAKGVGK